MRRTNIFHQKALILDGVTKRYDSIIAVNRVSLEVENREFIAIVGPSGCGKTTLLRLVAGVEKLDEGHIYIQGNCMDDVEPSKRGVRMVFQEHALWPHMRVFHRNMSSNLSFGMRLRKQLPQSIEETADLIAKRLGIAKNLFPRKPDQLSVGQKQMVGIGRALTIIPRILLLDEPFAHVDPPRRLTLRRELKEYHEKMESITLYVSHNLSEAFSMADRIAIMQDGKIIQVDSPSEIQNHPANEFVKDYFRCFEL
ncbi:MAG: ABC transporter ATP-binding protein [Desulfobacterales bacterium]|nr:MAG: ABC transporter ATP-binding protein [Desulfobacterales bacterium]